MFSKKCALIILSASICLFLTACGAKKESANAAIKAAEDAFNTVKSEAAQYVPDQAKSVEDAIQAAKASFDKGNFDEALNTAKAIPEKVKEISAAVASRKAEITKKWAEIAVGMPEMLDAIKSRLDMLKASKRLPKSLDKDKLELAETRYETAAIMWDEAKRLYSGGNMADVIPLVTAAKEDAMKAMEVLEMPAPEAPKVVR